MKKPAKDRRRHRRFPIIEGLVEPIEVVWYDDKQRQSKRQPAVLTNLSAGGMSLVTFLEPPHTKRIFLELSLPQLKKTMKRRNKSSRSLLRTLLPVR